MNGEEFKEGEIKDVVVSKWWNLMWIGGWFNLDIIMFMWYLFGFDF